MPEPYKNILETALRDPFLADYPPEYLQKLAKRLSRSFSSPAVQVRDTKVAVCGGFMTKFLAELLPLFFLHRGLNGTFYESDYGTFQQDILDEDSKFSKFQPELVVFIPTHRDLRYPPSSDADTLAVEKHLDKEIKFWTSILDKIKVPTVFLTFDPPPMRPLGEADGLKPGGLLNYVRAVNNRLAKASLTHVTLIDAECLCAEVGATLWHDERLYNMAKQPMSMEALPRLANTIAASASALFGRARKALVVDLDNTLWGGIVGDDGLEGIALGPETSDGESFVAFQKYLKSLSLRGIVLAVCSKNLPETALQPFKHHSAMILKETDFPAFVANFKDKATNIREIAKSLNLGLDSLVFIDDSPIECELVRKHLPEVWVIELSGSPSEFTRRLDRFIPFPVVALTKEDFDRNANYHGVNNIRSELEQTNDIDTFLRELEPEVILENVRDDTVERMSQLIGKTNQFKLNPTAFSTSELRERAADVLAFRLKDRIQDYGIVSVIVTDPDHSSGCLIIQNWVMSCRVFSRRLEFLIREMMAEKAEQAGLSQLRLEYIKSGRNGLIGDLLPALGFSASTESNWFEADIVPPANVLPHFISLRDNT